MTHQEKTQLLQSIIDRTDAGQMDWYCTDKEIQCKVAGLKFVIASGSRVQDFTSYDWSGNLSIFEDSILLSRDQSDTTSFVKRIKDVALTHAKAMASARLRQVMLNLSQSAPVISDLEVNREG